MAKGMEERTDVSVDRGEFHCVVCGKFGSYPRYAAEAGYCGGGQPAAVEDGEDEEPMTVSRQELELALALALARAAGSVSVYEARLGGR